MKVNFIKVLLIIIYIFLAIDIAVSMFYGLNKEYQKATYFLLLGIASFICIIMLIDTIKEDNND